MTQLVWKDVDGPRFDLSGLAMTAEGVTRSFDRLGQSMINFENTNRQKYTDNAIAEAMMLQDPEAVKARLTQGVSGLNPKVNARAFMEALGAHQNQLMETERNREEMLNLKAVGEMGDEGAQFAALMGAGKRDEALAYAASVREQNPDMWGRVAYQYGIDGEGLFDKFTGRELERGRDAETAAYHQGSLANERSRIGIDAMRARGEAQERGYRIRALDRAEQTYQQGLKDRSWADTYANNFSLSSTPDEVIAGLKKGARYTGSTDEQRKALEDRVLSTFNNRVALTQGQIEEGNVGRTSGGMPGYLLNGGGAQATVQDLRAGNTAVANQTQVAKTALTNKYMMEHPDLDVMMRAEQKKPGSVDKPMLENFIEANKLDISKEDLNRALGMGLTHEQVMALLESQSPKNASFFSGRGQEEFLGWNSLMGIPGQAYGAYKVMTSGQKDFLGLAAKLVDNKSIGERDKSRVELESQLQGPAVAQAKLDRAMQKIEQYRGAGKTPPQKLLDERDAALQLQREFRATVLPK